MWRGTEGRGAEGTEGMDVERWRGADGRGMEGAEGRGVERCGEV